MYIPQFSLKTMYGFLNDIVNNVGGFISHDQFCYKYGKIIPYFQYIIIELMQFQLCGDINSSNKR